MIKTATWILALNLVGQLGHPVQKNLSINLNKLSTYAECQELEESLNRIFEKFYWRDYLQFVCRPEARE